MFGQLLSLDLHNCDVSKFNRADIKRYFIELCDLIEMEREDLHFWDYEGVPADEIELEEHLLGTSAVQFIRTSNIVIHTLDLTGNIYLDVFSCKNFKEIDVIDFTESFFGGKVVNKHCMERL